jgi:multiple sugar transport system substrate-binding protein
MGSVDKKKDGITRRKFMKTVGTAGAVGTLSLAGPGIPFIHARKKPTLRFLNMEPNADCVRVLKVAGGEYESRTGVKVVVDTVPAGDAYAKVTASIKAGRPYDIAGLLFIGHVLLLAQEGHLAPVTSLIKKHDWGPRILFPYKGEHYWYMYDYNLCWLYYRKDLYKQKGLKEPDTWAQMLDNCKALMMDENKDGRYERYGIAFPIGSNSATNYMTFPFMWAEGVEIFDDNWNVIIDSPEMAPKVIRYLDFFAELYRTMPSGLTQISFAPMMTMFASKRIGHTAYPGRLITNLEKNAPDITDKWDMMPYPDSKGVRKAVNHGYDGWVVLKTKQTEESMKFMEWFTEEKYIDFLHTVPLHFQPPRMDVYENPKWRAHPMIEKYWWAMEQMWGFLKDPNLVIASIDTQGPYVDFRPGKVFNSYALPEMIQNKVLRNMPSDECLKTAAAKMRKVLA